MKESKLLKEVVRRSVEPELNDISERILEDHKLEHDHPSVTVRPRYLTRAVACFAIVFALGLISGLVITKNMLRKGPEANTAPNIIDTNSRDPNSAEDIKILVPDKNELPYLNYNGYVYYSFGMDGERKSRDTIMRFTVSQNYLNYLSTLDFIGIVAEHDSFLTSNFVPEGSVVFKVKEYSTYFVYTKDGIYRFGNAISPDLSRSQADISLPEPSGLSPISSISLHYKDKTYYFGTRNNDMYASQSEMINDASVKSLLDDAVFLGLTSGESLAGQIDYPVISGIYVRSNSPVFYSRSQSCFFCIYYENYKFHILKLALTSDPQ